MLVVQLFIQLYIFYHFSRHSALCGVALDNDTSVNLENANVKPERNKSKFSKEKKILAGVALTLAVGIGGGMAANFAFNRHPASAVSASSSENVSGKNSTSETSSDNRSESAASSETPEVLPTVESLELDGSLASNLNNVGKAFCNELTNWFNSGATDENEKRIIPDFDGNEDKLAQQEAAKYDALYEKALFKDVSSLDDNTTYWLKNNITTLHEGVLKDFLATDGNTKMEGDLEPYNIKVNFKSAGGLTWMGSTTVQLCSYNSDNSDKNTVGKVESSNISADETRAIGFEVIDGKIKITKIG